MNKFIKPIMALILLLATGAIYADSLIHQVGKLVTSSPTVRGQFSQTKTLSGVSKKLDQHHAL